MSFRLVPKSMTLNVVTAFILRYFTEFGSLLGELRKSGWQSHNYGHFTITVSSINVCRGTERRPRINSLQIHKFKT